MKKLFAFIAALLVLGCVVYAEVSVKELGDGNVEVTFFYGNPKATEVVIAGSFTDWQNGALPMTKVEKGWEYKGTFAKDAVLKYKFISDGAWTADLKAPALVDDGFGGKNGEVNVANIIAIEKAKASGDTAALAKLSSTGLKFGAYTQVNLLTNFITADLADPSKKGFEVDSVKVYADSNFKLSGDILPNMPTFIEIKAFSSTKTLYGVSPTGKVTTKFSDGINEFATGLFFNPYKYMGMNGGNPLLGKLKVGVNTKYVNLETGYFWADASNRSNILWGTLDGDHYDANDGYFLFANGAGLQQFGDVKVDAGIMPNKIKGPLGLASWLNVGYSDLATVEVHWDALSKETTNASEFFDDFSGDLVIGAKGGSSGVSVAAQAVVPVASKTVKDAVAYEASASYNADMYTVKAMYGSFQDNASLVYGDADDVAGNKGKGYVSIDASVKPMDGVKAGLVAKLESTEDFDFDKTAGKENLYFKPSANLDLAKLAGVNVVTDMYAEMNYNVLATKDAFTFDEFGMKASVTEISEAVPSVDVWYALRNSDKVRALHSLIASIATKPGIGVDLGLGISAMKADATQAEKDANDMLAFIVGADYTVKALHDGVFYGAFVYNMDPYEAQKDSLKWSDYHPDSGYDSFAGKAQFRLGMKWDF